MNAGVILWGLCQGVHLDFKGGKCSMQGGHGNMVVPVWSSIL